MKRIALGAVFMLAAGLTACATTSFTSTWKAPDAQPLGSLVGKKVVGVAFSGNAALRRSAEDSLVSVLAARGAEGVPSYSLISDADIKNEERAKAAIEKSGAVAVIVMRPVSKEQSVTATPSMYMGPRYRPYWGGYWGYGWGSPWVGGVDVRTDTIVNVETLVYSLAQNQLVWAGQSKTTNPSRIDAFVKEVAAGVGQEMKKAGLL